MLTVDSISVEYGGVRAVSDVSFEVEEGRAVTMVGPNGAGKTSTLLALAGVVPLACGEVLFAGANISDLIPEERVRRGLSLVPEGRHIFSTLSVYENLKLGAIARRDRASVQGDTDAFLERFPVLGKLRDRPAGQLSGGEQQQLAIARALLARPRLLMLDEPSLGLAPLIVDQVFDILADLSREGVTILLVEQNAARAIEFADHTFVLARGRVVLQGAGDDILARPDFADRFLGMDIEA